MSDSKKTKNNIVVENLVHKIKMGAKPQVGEASETFGLTLDFDGCSAEDLLALAIRSVKISLQQIIRKNWANRAQYQGAVIKVIDTISIESRDTTREEVRARKIESMPKAVKGLFLSLTPEEQEEFLASWQPPKKK